MGSSGTHLPATSRARGPGDPAVTAPSARTTATVSARGLTKGYDAGIPGCAARVEAVRGVDFDAYPGDALGILGPAGAGKSTLMLCLAGLLRPDNGTVSWYGRVADDTGRPPGIVYVPERAVHYAFMTVREAVEFHAVLRDLGGADRAACIDDALELCGLTAIAGKRIGDLPWTAGPRVSLAQALVHRPRALLLDETFAGLDVRAREDIARALTGMVAGGMTVIAAADDLDALDGVATRALTMMDGRIGGPIERTALERSRMLELSIATPALARRVFGARVAEEAWDRHVLRLPLEGTTSEAILARCAAAGVRVEGSRVIGVPCAEAATVVDGASAQRLPD